VHLPLLLPPDCGDGPGIDAAANITCGITVGGVTKRWSQWRALVLDDSFLHEVSGDLLSAGHHAPW
jgi:hypothetical protein